MRLLSTARPGPDRERALRGDPTEVPNALPASVGANNAQLGTCILHHHLLSSLHNEKTEPLLKISFF